MVNILFRRKTKTEIDLMRTQTYILQVLFISGLILIYNSIYSQCSIQFSPSITQNKLSTCNGPVLLSVSGSGLQFDGVDDYVSVQNTLATSQDFTIEAWVYLDQN